MSKDEITASPQTAADAQIRAALLDVHTASPGIIISFDPDTRTATVQPAIQRVFLHPDSGEQTPTNLPPCVDVPVYFPSGGGFELTFPVTAGDHCLLVFAERCIDSWAATGEPAPPDDYRQHDLSDAFALVGVWPQGARPAVWMGGAELRGGSDYLRLSTGKLETNCVIHAPNVITPSVNVNTHVHGGVHNGAGITNTPTPST